MCKCPKLKDSKIICHCPYIMSRIFFKFYCRNWKICSMCYLQLRRAFDFMLGTEVHHFLLLLEISSHDINRVLRFDNYNLDFQFLVLQNRLTLTFFVYTVGHINLTTHFLFSSYFVDCGFYWDWYYSIVDFA